MKFARLLEQIQFDEGLSLSVYQDIVGVWTIGYGTTWIAGERVTEHTPDITHAVASDLLKADVYAACIDAQDSFDCFNKLSYDRQEVLVNMSYNLGRAGLAKFIKFKAAMEAKEFNLAALEMVDSKWYRQVGNRAKRLVNRMA